MSSNLNMKHKENEGKENLDFWFICPKCKNSIPLLSHFYSEEKQKWQIEIRCSCEKNSSYSMDISEFLRLKSSPKNIKEILFINYIENGLENKGKTLYCKKCEKILDNESLEKHNDHAILNLLEESKKVDDSIEKIISEFDTAQNNIEINNEISKAQQIYLIDEEIEKLKNMKEKIELAYKENQEINKLFIDYVQIIINNYKNSRKLDNNLVNYNILKNILNNTEFNMNKFQESEKNVLETSEKLCSFYRNNFVIRRKFNELEIDQKINLEHNVSTFCKISKEVFAIGEGGRKPEKESYNIQIFKRDKAKNEYKLFKNIEKAHNGEITSLCKISINNNDYLLSGDSSDKLINVYDIKKNFKKVMYLSGHKRKIVSIISLNKMYEFKNWIASCSTGLNIKLWDLSEIPNLLSNNNNKADSNKDTSSDNNNIITNTNIAEPIQGPEIKYSIKGHIKSLKCLYQLNDGTLITSASDKKLKFWDLEKKICIKTLDDVFISSSNAICELGNNRIVVGCFDVIKIINFDTLIIENELKAHEIWINCLSITPDGLLFSGDSEGVLILWEICGEGKKIYSTKKESAIKTIDLLGNNKITVGLLNSCLDVIKYK
jgi:WD40 repeat protein